MLLLYRRSEEKAAAEEKPDDGLPFFRALGMLFRNKYWVQLLIIGLFTAVTYSLTSASTTYYAKWILGNDNLVALLGGVGLIPTFLGFALVGPMTKKWGIRKTLLICFGIGIGGSLVRVFFPSSLIVLLTAGMLPSFALIPIMCLQSPMNSLAVDYNDYLFDNKIVGMAASASSFGGKIASGIGGSLIGWILAAANYDPNVAEVTMPVRYGIYTFSIYLPMAMLVAMFLIVYRFDIESKYTEIMAEVHARRAAAAAEEE